MLSLLLATHAQLKLPREAFSVFLLLFESPDTHYFDSHLCTL